MKTLAKVEQQAEIRGRLQKLSPGHVRAWGRMSVQQMVCHLGDAFRMALGEKAVHIAPTLLQRTVVKWVALSLPLPWPGGRISTSPELDQETGAGTMPGDFATDLALAETLLNAFLAHTGSGRWPRHPVFGTMTEADWLRWGYLHADHHLRQFGA